MKKILIVHSNMEIGGAESSLIGLLYSFDYSKVKVDLFLYERTGELLSQIPKEVNLLPEMIEYKALMSRIVDAVKNKQYMIAFQRLVNKAVYRVLNIKYHFSDYGYVVKQGAHFRCLPYLPMISEDKYDAVISYNDPHFIIQSKVKADRRIGWFHTDFSRITVLPELDHEMWERCDNIVFVSNECEKAFVSRYPDLNNKTKVIYNIIPEQVVIKQSTAFSVESEMPDDGRIKLLSIGRFCYAKNFDQVPDICARILKEGLDVVWYIIGYGGDEQLIKEKIKEYGMQGHVIILGKKGNPYPYIKACDYYVQPSRYEGNSVTVHEAQVLKKPIIITNYVTAKDQITDGVDGFIVPMDNEGCAKGIEEIIKSKKTAVAKSSKNHDLEKIYQLI